MTPFTEASLEAWIDESFPILADDQAADSGSFWNRVYRYTMRRRFDLVCVELQKLLVFPSLFSALSEPIRIVTEILLAYPGHRQRGSNPYALGQWRLDMQARLKAENLTSWNPHLVNLVTLLEGEVIPPSVRVSIASWPELFLSKLVLSSRVQRDYAELAKECMAEKPSSFEPLDSLSLDIFHGSLDLNKLKNLPFIGPHLLDVLYLQRSNIGQTRDEALRAYAEELTDTPLWNLSTDYFWSSSPAGRERLEQILFRFASESDSYTRNSVIDICHIFELNVLADAIHVMIAEEGRPFVRVISRGP